jgi:hypothetical protein
MEARTNFAAEPRLIHGPVVNGSNVTYACFAVREGRRDHLASYCGCVRPLVCAIEAPAKKWT